MASLGRLLDMRVHGRGPVGLDLVEQGMGHELVVALCQVTWLPECFSKGIRILTSILHGNPVICRRPLPADVRAVVRALPAHQAHVGAGAQPILNNILTILQYSC